jgi:dihydroneopterin aldolase
VDRIELTGMVFSGHHGVTDKEREHAQPFTVDVEVETDTARAGDSDDIADTIDYRRLRQIAERVISGPSASLIEALAERIAEQALEVPAVRSVEVRVAKQPASMQPIAAAAVRIKRERA